MSEFEQQQETVRNYVKTIDEDPAAALKNKHQILEILERYECWAPFFRLIRKSLDEPQSRSVSDFVELARIQNTFLEDVFEAAETCSQAVAEMQISYEQFVQEVIPDVVGFEDWSAEATVLEAAAGKFATFEDKVKALERICLLYEKKIFNESQLNESYTKLLAMDEKNVKALRYFKLVYTQNYNWEKVVEIINKLLKASQHPQNVFRLAQELAAVHLYQLDQPKEAIDVIEHFCQGSPLDTSTIHFDAYQRLGDWDGCIRVLRECLLTVKDQHDKAVLNYKMGTLEEKIGHFDSAEENYGKAVELWPRFYEPYEQMIYLASSRRNWEIVHKLLAALRKNLQQPYSLNVVSELMERLKNSGSEAQS